MTRARLDPFQELALKIKALARGEAEQTRTPPLRFKVNRVSPLRLEQLDGELLLEEGDDDFEIAHAVDAADVDKGDQVLVHEDADGDFIAVAVVKRGNDG